LEETFTDSDYDYDNLEPYNGPVVNSSEQPQIAHARPHRARIVFDVPHEGTELNRTFYSHSL